MSRIANRTVWIAAVVLGFAIPVLIPACGADRALEASNGDGVGVEKPGTSNCQTPQEGCACAEEGQRAECGKVKELHGDQVFCAMGAIVCEGGRWGKCSTSNVTTKSLSGLKLQSSPGVSSPGSCISANPCDPNCNLLDDEPSVATLPPGLVYSGGGITIPGAGAEVACKIPTTPSAVYAALPAANRPNGGPPSTCSSTPNDTCGMGMKCSAGTCVPRAVSETSCTGNDFTIETPCWDGSRMNMQVCNRGTVAATSGTLRIAHFTGTSNAAFTFPGPSDAGAPALPPMSTVGAAGDCTIDLAVRQLPPGACTSFVPTSDCPASVTSDTGDHFYYVNRSNTGGALLAECNTCNNFSATNGTITGAAAACNDISCGGGGSSCTGCLCGSGSATVSGQVLDPISLRPVYGATIYVPSTAVGVTAGALDGPNVTCDRCTSTFKGLPVKASTTSGVDGNFTLEGVPAGTTFPMVIQLGRFRRQITMPAITTCGTYDMRTAAGRAKTHLPGTTAMSGDTVSCGGAVTPPCDAVVPDMPKMAIVTGKGDALECLLYKMGIQSSEFTAPTTTTSSVHLYMYKNANLFTGTANSTANPATNGGNNIKADNVGLTFTGGAAGNCYSANCDQQRVNSMGNAASLLDTPANINKYNLLVLPCPDTNSNPSATMQSNVRAWLDAGGRLFASHHEVEDFIRFPNGNPNAGIANWSTSGAWSSGSSDPNDRSGSTTATTSCNTNGTGPCSTTAHATACNAAGGGSCTNKSWLVSSIDQSFPSGAALNNWLQLVWPTTPYGGPGNPTPPSGRLPLPDYRHDVNTPVAPTVGWFGGTSTYTGTGGGPQISMLSFDTPRGTPAADQCGRAVLPFMHVSPKLSNFGATSGTVPTFPAACGAANGALTGQELAFEFMLWESLRCLAPLSSTPYTPEPPVITAPPPLTSAEVYRDFDATCAPGSKASWGFLEWQSLVPSLTSVEFRAATTDNLVATPFPAASTGAMPRIGVADRTTAAGTWDKDHQTTPAKTVDEHFGGASKRHVRVYMKFNPTATAAPVLYDWRLMYSCIANE